MWVYISSELNMPLFLQSAFQLTLIIWCFFRAETVFETFQLTGKYRIPIPLNLRMNDQSFTNA